MVRLNAEGQIGIGERCVDADKNAVKLIYCPMGTASGPWLYDEETKLLKHKNQGRCLVVHPSSNQLMLRECDVGNTLKTSLSTSEDIRGKSVCKKIKVKG
ncbi:unnamed protein product [Allacma fusca]|uniref:Ricin B lectin domain-containing protein n=1 Tax=Allacma fusca TaxID=39272 RepID=A0A8J2KA78_9HEXA|nr:unnamed protein product [Allacma fusca]